MSQPILIETTVNAAIDHVWACYTSPEHIVHWNNASDDWHTPSVNNDLRTGGKFVYTMAAKDGSASFDFGGDYDLVEEQKAIHYHLADGRTVKVGFEVKDAAVRVTTEFDPEQTYTPELQQQGWQAILDNFKRYTEAQLDKAD